MIIGGTNVADWGVIVGDRSPTRSAVATKQIIEGAPGAWRRIRMGMGVPDAARISLTGHIVGTSLANLRSNIDRFKYELRPDAELTIGFSDYSDREWLGYRQSLVINDITPGWVTEGVRFSLVILSPDPFARDPSFSNLAVTPGALPLEIEIGTMGTAPMPVVITIEGNTSNPIVNPVLRYRNSSDDDVAVLSIVETGLLSGEFIVIDTEFFTAEKDSVNIGGAFRGS